MDDLVRRKDVIDALHGLAHRFEDPEDWCILEGEAEFVVSKLPTAEPEIMPDGTLHITATVDVANINRILLSQKGTHLGALYYKDE